MRLYEELFLLSLNDQKGDVSSAAVGNIGFGLSGAILSELVLAGKIGLDAEKHVLVLNQDPIGEDLLDEALKRINEYPRQRKVSFWINRLSESVKKLQRRVGMGLVEKGVLQLEEKRYLWVIPYDAFPQIDASAKYWVKHNLRLVVLTSKKADPASVALLGLVRACNMLEFVFTRDELKAARLTIDGLTIGDEIGIGIQRAIEAIETAAIAASLAASAG